ncbi:MAG TPA: hypothetical protein VKB86_19155 [Pyrinomonadaceae bacterium]|nr:hypothetical protein [Pyrinomonadaceae bacterium]
MSGGLFIFGRETKKDYGPTLLLTCPNCRNKSFFILIYVETWLEYFWIKIFAYKKRYHLLCDTCSRGVELEGSEVNAAKRLNKATIDLLNKSISAEQYNAVLDEEWNELGMALGYLLK